MQVNKQRGDLKVVRKCCACANRSGLAFTGVTRTGLYIYVRTITPQRIWYYVLLRIIAASLACRMSVYMVTWSPNTVGLLLTFSSIV
jgi:hypothetical protein